MCLHSVVIPLWHHNTKLITCFEFQSLAIEVNFSVRAFNFIFPAFTHFIIKMQVQRSGRIVAYCTTSTQFSLKSKQEVL